MNYYVYRFKDESGDIIYVGRTDNLDRRFSQHEHLTDDVKIIEYIECQSEADMLWKEIYYINLYKNDKTTNAASIGNGSVTDLKLNDIWNKYELINKTPKHKYISNTEDPDNLYVITKIYYMLEFNEYVTNYNKKENKTQTSIYLKDAKLYNKKYAESIIENLNDYSYSYYYVIENFEDCRRSYEMQDNILEEKDLKNDIMKQHDEKHKKDFSWYYNHPEKYQGGIFYCEDGEYIVKS